MVLVKSLLLKGSTDFGKVKADLEDVAVRTRKLAESSPTIKLGVDDGAATLKLAAFRQELRTLKDAGSQSGLSDLASRLKTFGNETGTTRTKMAALKLEADALKASMGGSGGRGGVAGAAGDAEGAFGGMAGPLGMGAAISAAAALSPVLVTLGTGLAGFGAAAYGTIASLEKAASKTGGLRANMAKLDPEQRAVAKSILGLGKEYDAFQKALEPEVIGAFNQGIKIAGNLMTDVEPVAAATGKAFSQFLGAFGTTLQDPEWKQFWAFMAKTAPQDMRLLGGTVIDLANDLPPLLESLQGVGTATLKVTDAISKGVGAAEKLDKAEFHLARTTDSGTVAWTNKYIPGARTVNRWLTDVQHTLGGTSKATGQLSDTTTQSTKVIGANITALRNQVRAADAATLAVLGLQGDQASWRQAQQAATAAVNANHHALDGNSKSALAARQAIIGATGAALTFAQGEQHTSRGAAAASRVLQDQIGWLEKHAAKSRIAAAEIAALRAELAKLRQIRDETVFIHVHGAGKTTFRVGTTGLTGMAGGGRIPGYGGGDVIPILAERGETVVDKDRSRRFAPLLKAMGVPGYQRGGVVTGGNLADDVARALRIVHGRPHLPDILHDLAVRLGRAERDVRQDRDLLRLGLGGGRAERELAGDRSRRDWLERQIRPLHRLRHEVAVTDSVLLGRDARLRASIAAARREHLPGVGAALEGRLHWHERTERELHGWLGKVGIERAEQARRRAAAAARRIAVTRATQARERAEASTMVDWLSVYAPLGMESGGVVGSYSGTALGAGQWMGGQEAKARDMLARFLGADLARLITSAGGAPAVSGGGGPAAALFRRMYPAWASGPLWDATNYVAMRESGWNPYAYNASSGAAGIAQRIQGWAPFYQPGNAFQQDKWFHDYMASRYGGPLGAAAHERAYSWYGNGFHGWVDTPTVFGAGERGRERVDITPAGRAGNTYNITVNVPVTASKRDVGRQVVEAIREYERGSGKGWRS